MPETPMETPDPTTRSISEFFGECKRITEELISSPCGSLFSRPVNPIIDDCPSYNKVVNNPQDLGTILWRLNEGKYQSPKDWVRDVNLVWSNAILYHGEGSHYSSICQYMKAKFEKLCKKVRRHDHRSWILSLVSVVKKLNTSLSNAPGSVRPMINVNAMRIIHTEEEIQHFVEVSTHLNQPDDVAKMVQIMLLYGYHLDTQNPTADVNLSKVPHPVVHTLMLYAKERMKEMGIPYEKKIV